MNTLSNIKVILEIVVLMVFLGLLIHVARRDGRKAALGLLTNLP